MTSAYIFKILIPCFLMSLNDDEKWASEINELLEEIAIVDKNINSTVKKISVKCTNTTKTSYFKEVDMSNEDSKSFEDRPVNNPYKTEDDSDDLYQTSEVECINQEVSDTIFDGKVNFQDVDHTKISPVSTKIINMCREVSGSSDSLNELQNSSVKIIEAAFKDICNTDNGEGELNVDDFDDKHSAILVNNSRGLNALKDKHACKTEEFIHGNSSQTDENRIHTREESFQKVDYVKSNPLGEEFESEKYLERVDQKVRCIGFGSKHDKNMGEKAQESSLMDAYYEWFNENFIREEMEFRRTDREREYRKETRRLSESEINGKTAFEKGDLVINHETTNVASNEVRENNIIQNENNVINKNGKMVNCMATQPKGVNKYIEEDVNENFRNEYENKEYHHFGLKLFEKDTDLSDVAKISPICSTVNSSIKTTCRDLRNLNLSTNSISMQLMIEDVSLRPPPRKRLIYYRAAVEDPGEAQRFFRIRTVYRNACRRFEVLALRPTAILIAQLIDALVFVFFLSVSIFYFFYRCINMQKLRDIFKKSEKSSDNSSNREELSQRENPDNDSLSFNSISNGDVRNHELRRTESWHSFCPDDNDEEKTLPKDDLASVAPENACALNSECKHTNQILEDICQKGSDFWGHLCNDHAKAVLVDIIVKNSRLQDANLKNEKNPVDVKDKAFGVSNSDLEIVRNSDESFESKENTPGNISAFANKKQNISFGGIQNEYRSNIIESGANDSFFADFSTFAKKNCENILNSTEIGTSDLEIRSINANNFFKALSPSEINMFDGLCGIYQPSGSFSGECLQNSCLSIKAHSFSSVPSKNSILNNPSSFQISTPNKETSEPPLEEGPDRCRKASCDEIPSTSRGENLRRNLESNLQLVSEYSDSSSHISDIGDGEIYKYNTLCEDSFAYDNPEVFSNTAAANTAICNEDESLMDQQESAIPVVKSPKRRKKGIVRRRVTDVLNYCRRMNLIQIVSRKKKYGKQIAFNDLLHF